LQTTLNGARLENPKFQAPTTKEAPNCQKPNAARKIIWCLDIGVSLGFGYWVLGFPNQTRAPALVKKNGNHSFPFAVIGISVDTISTATWLISTLLSWFRLPYGTMMKRLANWFAVFIRLSRKWSARIDRDELVKRIFAK